MGRLRLCALGTIAPLLLAQSGGTVEGRVVSSATHAAIGAVEVTLRELSPPARTMYRASTNAEGAFRITDMPTSEYEAEFAKSGFGDRSPKRNWNRIRVVAGETVRLSVELVPLGILRGRVEDEEGRPVPKARIELEHMRGGSAGITETDANGRFELSESGTFTLMAKPAGKTEARTRISAANERLLQAPSYFPHGVLRSQAARIVLRPGEVLDGYEIRVPDVPAYRLCGTVLDERDEPLPGVLVRLVAPDQWNGAAEAQAVSGTGGAFAFDSVWARDWELTAQARRADAVLKGYGTATVSKADVDGILIRVSPPFTMSGTLEGPHRLDEEQSVRTTVWLFAEEFGESRVAAPRADGSFRFDRVYPGRYTITPLSAPPGLYFDSVFLGSRGITGEVVDLRDGSEPIRVVFRPNPARVRGTVKDCRGHTVVLWRLDPPLLPGEYFRRATCDGNGRFEFAGLRPGEYYACAFAEVGDQYLIADVPFARSLSQRAARIRVDKGQTADVELKLLPWPE